MFRAERIAYRIAGTLNELVQAYLERDPGLSPFYSFFPDTKGFADLLAQSPYEKFDRAALREVLLKQAALVSNTSEASIKNIGLLDHTQSYTVSTGHQLCLFTGPLYFVYKLLSTINLAERLSQLHPEKKFVPVYWMASEDHDFDEVNHFFVNGHKVEWESRQRGAVGRFGTKGLEKTLAELEKQLGVSENSKYLADLFKRAYLGHNNLADATRYLVNELFGEYGVIILDADEPLFKNQFREIIRRDIFDHTPFRKLSETIARFEKQKWPVQVQGREINFFYLDEQQRVRIEQQGTEYTVQDTGLKWDRKQMEELIRSRPEVFSPNVVLRPLLQQTILPNLAYIGGPGELSYWLEFRPVFEALGVFFPILVPRNFISIAGRTVTTAGNKLALKPDDYFKTPNSVLDRLLAQTGQGASELEEQKRTLKELYTSIKSKAQGADYTLAGSAEAELHRALKGIDRLAKKIHRARRKKLDTESAKLNRIREELFPGGVPQERKENFSGFFLAHGKEFITQVKSHADPFLHAHLLLLED